MCQKSDLRRKNESNQKKKTQEKYEMEFLKCETTLKRVLLNKYLHMSSCPYIPNAFVWFNLQIRLDFRFNIIFV